MLCPARPPPRASSANALCAFNIARCICAISMCESVRIPGYVSASHPEQELRRIIALKQKRVPDRSVAVQTFEVQLRRSRIAQRPGIDMTAERRSIRGDVMRDELTEDWPPGRNCAQRAGRVRLIATVTQSAGTADRVKKCLVGLIWWEIGKHARVAGWTDRRLPRKWNPCRGKTMSPEGRADG